MLIGVLGGGQLGRMLALAAAPLGVRMRFLDTASDAVAGHVGELIVGSCDDEVVLDRFLRGVDRVTYEFENVPLETARRVERRAPLLPSSRALEHTQDRLVEKRLFRALHVPTAEFADVSSEADLAPAAAQTGLPAILKTRRLGYDGKGQARVADAADLVRAWDAIDRQPAILEGVVHFERELSIVAARGADGNTACYPLVQNFHRHGILVRTIAPAPGVAVELQANAENIAARLMDALQYTGALAIEFFELAGRLFANEFAPRVHNSGHWTIDAAQTSQFENHIRAIAGLPLGPVRPRGAAVMLNLIGQAPTAAALLAHPAARLHLYGKSPRPGRKIGHVTVCADSVADAQREAESVAALLANRSPADSWKS